MKQPRPLTEIQRDIDAVKEQFHFYKHACLKDSKEKELNELIKERQEAELCIRTQLS